MELPVIVARLSSDSCAYQLPQEYTSLPFWFKWFSKNSSYQQWHLPTTQSERQHRCSAGKPLTRTILSIDGPWREQEPLAHLPMKAHDCLPPMFLVKCIDFGKKFRKEWRLWWGRRWKSHFRPRCPFSGEIKGVGGASSIALRPTTSIHSYITVITSPRMPWMLYNFLNQIPYFSSLTLPHRFRSGKDTLQQRVV